MSTAVSPAIAPLPLAVKLSLAILGIAVVSFLMATVIIYDPAGAWSQAFAGATRLLPSKERLGLGLSMTATAIVLASALLAVAFASLRVAPKARCTFERLTRSCGWTAAVLQWVAVIVLMLSSALSPVTYTDRSPNELASLLFIMTWVVMVFAGLKGGIFHDDDAFMEALVDSALCRFSSPAALHISCIAAGLVVSTAASLSPAVATGLLLVLPFSAVCLLARSIAMNAQTDPSVPTGAIGEAR